MQHYLAEPNSIPVKASKQVDQTNTDWAGEKSLLDSSDVVILTFLFSSSRSERWWWFPESERTPRNLPLRPSRALTSLPVRTWGRLHYQEQTRQSLLQSNACHADLLQVQQWVGPSERPHCGREGGWKLRWVKSSKCTRRHTNTYTDPTRDLLDVR